MPRKQCNESRETTIAIVGLGYIGLPLAVAFDRKEKTIGFDVSNERISELQNNYDATYEFTAEEISASSIDFTDDPERLKEANFIIVAVPTPIDANKKPDLEMLKNASKIVGRNIRKGTIVVYESTVYPGATEEVCTPIIESESGLESGIDFTIGYSPERINPGDKKHTIDKIVKVVSAQDEETLETIANTYEKIVDAGIHRASSIKVAEAAKVIENTQRDLNIALMNELSIIFNILGLSMREVLEAAGTKWNFLKFEPGLVGGHCIGIDSYYLTFKAEAVGYHPEIILAGRRINDGMGKYVAEMTIKNLIKARKAVQGSRVLILGLAFKENVSDIRNSKVVDILAEFHEYGIETLVCDPLADRDTVRHEYDLELVDLDDAEKVDAIVWAVAHEAFDKIDLQYLSDLYREGQGVVIDVKSVLEQEKIEEQGLLYWSL